MKSNSWLGRKPLLQLSSFFSQQSHRPDWKYPEAQEKAESFTEYGVHHARLEGFSYFSPGGGVSLMNRDRTEESALFFEFLDFLHTFSY